MSIEKHQQLRERTRSFALQLLRFCRTLPNNREMNVIANQLLRNETVFWLELLEDGGLIPVSNVKPLLGEANELLRIFSASRNTARG